MIFKAKAMGVHYSPYKLRPIADLIRGKRAAYALAWCATNATRRTQPVKKVLDSAVANAKSLQNIALDELWVKRIYIDQGPIRRHFKPAAQGRAMPQRRRLCHINVELEVKTNKEARRGSEG